jgi:hypothetical protein
MVYMYGGSSEIGFAEKGKTLDAKKVTDILGEEKRAATVTETL